MGGAQSPCPLGRRHPNGGGRAPEGLPESVSVGPYAQILGGNVSGAARVEDHAIVLDGATLTGSVVGALSILNRFSVNDTARVETTFYPPGFFEPGQGRHRGSAVRLARLKVLLQLPRPSQGR